MKYKFSKRTLLLVVSCCMSLRLPLLLSQTPLTRAERSNYYETSLYHDVVTFLEQVQLNATSDVMHWTFFGTTGEGRDLPYVVLSNPRVAHPAEAQQSGKPIIFVMNNIHGGETDGKEASLMLIRDITQGKFRRWLDSVIILIVPLYNADGNERIGKFNRMAQVGPDSGMGIRTNAAGFDLARDYMKIEQPEGEALASLFNAWLPHFTIDTHTNDGSYHDFAIEYAYPQNANVRPIIIDYLKKTMMPRVSKSVEVKSGFKSQVYGTFVDEYHPEKGWETYPSFPRYGDRYRGLHNRLSILIESYPYTDFESRIEASYAFMIGCIDYVVAHPREILKVVTEAEIQTINAGSNPGRDSIGVRFQMVQDDEPVKIITFKIASHVDVSGTTHYARTNEKTTYMVPYIGKSIATKKVARPYAYIIPAAYKSIALKLLQHGITVETLRQPLETQVEVYRITQMECAKQPYQGHRMSQFTAQSEIRTMTFTAGTSLVRMAQPAGNVAAFLLEPETPDGYAAWNYFDNIGENNVIIVDQFLDSLGQRLLEKPDMRGEFDRLSERDPELNTNTEKRREFFLAHSPYADPNRYIFPVYRMMNRANMSTMLLSK